MKKSPKTLIALAGAALVGYGLFKLLRSGASAGAASIASSTEPGDFAALYQRMNPAQQAAVVNALKNEAGSMVLSLDSINRAKAKLLAIGINPNLAGFSGLGRLFKNSGALALEKRTGRFVRRAISDGAAQSHSTAFDDFYRSMFPLHAWARATRDPRTGKASTWTGEAGGYGGG